MMAEQVEMFRKGLVEETKDGKLEWKPLVLLKDWISIERELERDDTIIDFESNSISLSKSYYLQSGEGYVFVFEIIHGDPDVTSPEMNSMALMVKINEMLSIDNLTYFEEEEQEDLKTLQILIENYYDEKYSYPDILYNFFNQVIGGDST